MEESRIRLAIAYDETTGILTGDFINEGDWELTLRYVYEPTELHVQMEDLTAAQYYIHSSFGGIVDTFTLPAHGIHRFEIPLRVEFLFPREGWYRAWIDYDTSRKTSPTDDRCIDEARATSNTVSLFVHKATECEPVAFDRKKFLRQLDRERRPWWRLW